MPMRPPPTLPEVRNWCQIAPESLDDEQLAVALAAEQELQAEQCDLPPDPSGQGLIPSWAFQAQLRRVARECAARGLPLGMQSDGEGGFSRLSNNDAEINRLEGPYRKMSHG